MTRQIYILLTSIFMWSCSSDKQTTEKDNIIPSDTTLTFRTASQQFKISIDKKGAIQFVEINPNKNSQTVYFDKTGLVDLMTIGNGKNNVEHTLHLTENGQVKKIKSFDLDTPYTNDQFIWFASSPNKSLVIDLDRTIIPVVSGLMDTFDINKKYVLRFSQLTNQTKWEAAHFELSDIKCPKELETNSSKKNADLEISSSIPGTYRLRCKITLFYKKPKDLSKPYPLSQTEKVDILLHFRKHST